MDHTIELAIQREWKIFPLIYRSRLASEQPLLSEATSSVEQIKIWQQQFPDFPWGLATGPESGAFAVEFSRDLSIQKMRSLCGEDYSAMDTLQIRTPKSVTMFFRWPEAGLHASYRTQIAEGISIRQMGNYVELPSSRKESDGECTYCNLTASIKDAPDWLLNAIHRTFSIRRSADKIPFPASRTDTRLIGLSFANRHNRWLCNFLSIDNDGEIVKSLSLRSGNTILTLAERGGVTMNADTKQWISERLRDGRGNILLTLTTEQYEKLLAA
jgi:Bifunctional DNA primase/polymerase, N-terminal